jgi:hypothetical protein
MRLREEAIGRDRDGGERVKSWKECTQEFRDWYRESLKSGLVLEDNNSDSELEIPATNRFQPVMRKQLYAKTQDFARGVERDFENVYTVFLTFSASARSGAGNWNRCPANHLDDLKSAWPAVRRSLDRALEGRDWEYMSMLEPHEGGSGDISAGGYAHRHVAVFVDGPVIESQFDPVLQSHVSNCLAAGPEAHTLGRACQIKHDREIANLGRYLTKYLMKWGEDPLEAPEHVQRFNSLIWATGTRRWSVSDGAQEWVKSPEPDLEEGRDWEPTHFFVGDVRYPLSDRDTTPVSHEIVGLPGKDPPPEYPPG